MNETTIDQAAFAPLIGEFDDDFVNTVEIVGTRRLDRQYTDETEVTAVLRWTVELPHGGTRSYDVNAVHIGCPDCKQNATALIRPSGGYECVCGYENRRLTRPTLFFQGRGVEGEWEPY